MRKFNFGIFFILLILLLVVAFYTSDMALSRDEGKLGKNIFLNFLADVFNVLRFPLHVIFPMLAQKAWFFCVGLVINCLMYCLVIERLFYLTIKLIFFRNDPDQE